MIVQEWMARLAFEMAQHSIEQQVKVRETVSDVSGRNAQDALTKEFTHFLDVVIKGVESKKTEVGAMNLDV